MPSQRRHTIQLPPGGSIRRNARSACSYAVVAAGLMGGGCDGTLHMGDIGPESSEVDRGSGQGGSASASQGGVAGLAVSDGNREAFANSSSAAGATGGKSGSSPISALFGGATSLGGAASTSSFGGTTSLGGAVSTSSFGGATSVGGAVSTSSFGGATSVGGAMSTNGFGGTTSLGGAMSTSSFGGVTSVGGAASTTSFGGASSGVGGLTGTGTFGTVSAARKGMTWGKLARFYVSQLEWLGCNGDPLLNGKDYCNALEGDTLCSDLRPLLCLEDARLARPAYSVSQSNGGAIDEYYSGWTGGRVAVTAPILGSTLTSRGHADAICQSQFGTPWRMAEFHDGWWILGMRGDAFYGQTWDYGMASPGGWSFYARTDSPMPETTRYWVAINDQKANCWDAR